MVATLDYDAPDLSSVQKWATEFRRMKGKLENFPRFGYLAILTNEGKKNIDHFHDIIRDDRRFDSESNNQ